MTPQKHALVRRILEQLPPEDRYTFSEKQIEALHQSALSLPKATHAINIRWSVPFPGKGFYLVLFAGKERRSRKRLLADGDYQLLPRVVLFLGTCVGCMLVFAFAYSQRMAAISKQREAARLDNSSEEVHPTVVPFKYDREQCEATFREWKDGQ
ncbi:MAG: hypothetical protein F6K11_09455, partial [Leptolyngbya sp. SIO3F4]|nr:hypothetical protein [Leptolyngbya sp. SIO3F4]